MTRTLALLRVSTDLQSVDAQELQIAHWAQSQGLGDVDFRREPETSGVKARRPELDRLLTDVRRGRVDCVVVAALDRLGRSTMRTLLVLDELHARGVRFVSLREGFDLSTPMGQCVATILAAFAQLERETIRQRTKAGLASAKAKGVRLGRPGVRLAADVLRSARARLAAGESLADVAATLEGWRPTWDEKTGTWTERPCAVTTWGLRRALKRT